MGIPLTPSSRRERAGVRDLHQGSANTLQHRVRISKHFMIPKSKHAITQYLDIFSPSQVVRDLLGMLATIDLDDNFGLQAEEIHDVGSKDLLTSKLDALESSTTQSTPQAPLRLGRILPQRGPDCSSPHPRPLPVGGGVNCGALTLPRDLEPENSWPGPNKRTQITMRSLPDRLSTDPQILRKSLVLEVPLSLSLCRRLTRHFPAAVDMRPAGEVQGNRVTGDVLDVDPG